MKKYDEIELFLNEFKQKMQIWGVAYRDDRGKNAQSLLNLEIRPSDRDKLLKNLSVKDYSEGPIAETLYKGTDMWVFGKEVNNKEVYIKISIGFNGAQVICISFHVAEKPMVYPLKT